MFDVETIKKVSLPKNYVKNLFDGLDTVMSPEESSKLKSDLGFRSWLRDYKTIFMGLPRGCGKTTAIKEYLMDDEVLYGNSNLTNILIIQDAERSELYKNIKPYISVVKHSEFTGKYLVGSFPWKEKCRIIIDDVPMRNMESILDAITANVRGDLDISIVWLGTVRV